MSVVDFVERKYFPVEESLQICEQNNAVEACAVLNRRKGLYMKSIKLYMQVIVRLCVERLIHTITVEKNILFEDPKCSDENMQTFDRLLN